MIVSHKYKFIFIRPTKVAGTSVQVNLAKQCDDGDIVTSVGGYDEKSDETKFVIKPRNREGFHGHMFPDQIKEKIDSEIWNNYFKFTIVRNPYDLMVSRYHWHWSRPEKKIKDELIKSKIKIHMVQPASYIRLLKRIFNKRSKSFAETMKYFDKQWKNTRYYFDENGKPICDFYIKYENLDEDYKKVCEKVGIPYEPLPRLKTKQRKKKKHYSTYYDEKTKNRVSKIFKKELDFFDYKFEEEKEKHLTTEEEEQVKERLRALGYME